MPALKMSVSAMPLLKKMYHPSEFLGHHDVIFAPLALRVNEPRHVLSVIGMAVDMSQTEQNSERS